MATNPKQSLAATIACIKQDIENDSVTLKALTKELIQQVGEGGDTFVTDLGDVQVTQRTADRFGDELVVSFDNEVYLKLDRRTQNRLQALGVVKVDRKKITGQAPKVVVRLK